MLECTGSDCKYQPTAGHKHPKDAGSESDRRSARAVLRVFSDVYGTLGQGQSLLGSCPPQEHVQAA